MGDGGALGLCFVTQLSHTRRALAQSLPRDPSPGLEKQQKAKKRPRVEVQAIIDEAPPSEWGSLLGDLARPSARKRSGENEVDWRVHDRTHLEFAIDYPFSSTEEGSYTWEAFFFVPESFRLDAATYDKKEMYEDLLSYVRLAIPEVAFDHLSETERTDDEPTARPPILGEVMASLRAAEHKEDGSTESRIAIRKARVFACLVRGSGLDAQRALLTELDASMSAAEANGRVGRFVASANRVAHAYRKILADAQLRPLPEEVLVALRWVDEDMSLVLEAIIATASVRAHDRKGLGRTGEAAFEVEERSHDLVPMKSMRPNMTAQIREPTAVDTVACDPLDGSIWSGVAARLASEAVAEARYRENQGYPSVGSANASARDVEHLEFRRHMLKRFTSSALWLTYEVKAGASWVVQLLYALAAAVAMAFAVFATQRASQYQGYVVLSVLLAVASYAIKDRMKAQLQTALSKWAERRFPDRRWEIRDNERSDTLGSVLERAGFRPFDHLPEGVLAARRLTREHALEEFARPERVLWHEKAVKLEPRDPSAVPWPMLTEIFRLNIGPWLAHTDDPNRTITFADPKESCIYSATARRVYNINVVYRMRKGTEESMWRRLRVVVSRKGIERIDPIV